MFRELLQNSDDAQSRTVEIRFETQSYLDRNSGEGVNLSTSAPEEPLPDLKTTVVRNCLRRSNSDA